MTLGSMRRKSRSGSMPFTGGSRRRSTLRITASRGSATPWARSPGLTILDLGCGKGRFARALQAEGAEVTGLDLRRRCSPKRSGVDRVRGSARRLPFRPALRRRDRRRGVRASRPGDLARDAPRGPARPGAPRGGRGGRQERWPRGTRNGPGCRASCSSGSTSAGDAGCIRPTARSASGGSGRASSARKCRCISTMFGSCTCSRPPRRSGVLFRKLPTARLMALWVARADGGADV